LFLLEGRGKLFFDLGSRQGVWKMNLKNLVVDHKKKLLFLGSFVVCPCPFHGTLLGLSLVAGTALIEKLKKDDDHAR